jgi:hypothetical protein
MAARVTAFVVFAIVAVTFVAGLIVGAQRADDSGPVDLIVYNARVYTGEPDRAFAEAIAIRGNRILRVGSNRDIKRLMRRATTVIDAHGGSVTAGFHDGHVNLKAAGLALATASTTVDPPTPAPPPISEGRRPAMESKPAEDVRADTGEADDKGDTLDTIRRALGEANRVGVTSVGVTARTPDDLLPYDTLLRTRELTARVTAALAADWPLDDAALARLDATRKRYEGVPFFKVEAIRLTVSDGLDDIQAGLGPGQAPRPLARPASAAAGSAVAPSVAVDAAHESAVRAVRASPRGAAKAVPEAASATEELVAELGRTIAALELRGWQIILETRDAGDAELALSAVESTAGAPGNNGPSADSKRRIRLELGAALDDEAITRLTRLRLIASVQTPASPEPRSTADASDRPESATPAPADEPSSALARSGEGDTEALPAETEDTQEASPFANVLAAAAPFVFHSGWPSTPLDPRFALSAALVDPSPEFSQVWTKSEARALASRLARALDAYTRHAAYATANEDQQGTIAKEMLADLVIFSTDLFTLPRAKLLDTEVATTIFDGKVVYSRQLEPAGASITQ